jgi:hypothetical protein
MYVAAFEFESRPENLSIYPHGIAFPSFTGVLKTRPSGKFDSSVSSSRPN